MTRARRAQRGFPHRIYVTVLTRCCRQSQAVQERQATVDSLNGKLMDGKRAKVALEERTLQELAAIEESTANAAEERKRAAELLVAVSRQVRRLCARFPARRKHSHPGALNRNPVCGLENT